MFDSHAPRTMMILGAALSGGDAMALAKRILESDLTSSNGEVVLSSEDNSNSEKNDEVERSSGTG